ncbi:hypothetical protein [Pseudomonas syringae]|uniref:hypothetical protein n=1 Tax=Pseudomonas syringae TaxID=317 RepID=UPI001F1E3091|nr:hypothetical protein [Pseudomonas syringae]MCF5736519.1 hypothetical protein [Pseudomonas syringae]MCF5742718.1 hypothetical protein [Pseudomonas syringae]MCF5751578.1 hypothetical protein [Pseudomonas syringae]MCF5754615.1 hypothetical protein [Pseudomonas syringae]
MSDQTERYRRESEIPLAHGELILAAENFPHLIQLRTLAADFDPCTPIAWLSIIYPGINMQQATSSALACEKLID